MKQKHIYNLAALLLASSAAFISCSDNDLDGPQTDGDRGASVVFNIKDIQQDNIAKVDAATRAGIAPTLLYTPGLTQEDLAPRRLEAVSSDGLDACLIETTVEGINPTKPDPTTRARVKTSIDGFFSTSGYRGDSPSTISNKPEWFYNKKTKSDGTLTTPLLWAWGQPYARFYAVFPEVTSNYSKIKLSPETHQGSPYIEFEAEKLAINQKDLLTACSGEVHYSERGKAPQTDLEFRHALTAVKFAIGQNLSWNKHISKIEIIGACSKGKYTLSDRHDGVGAAWSDVSTPETFPLNIPSPYISTADNPNTVIVGKPNDNYTFYMIPQELTGKNVQVVITLSDGNPITVTLTGEWKAGTTKTYKLSQNTSEWVYTFTATSLTEVAHDVTTANYDITSYRTDPSTNKQQEVRWEVVSYQESTDGGNTWTAESKTKPSWLTSLSKESGNGGTVAETMTATLKKDVNDMLEQREQDLKNAMPKGDGINYYDLSTKGSTTPSARNTANCYIISAPGYYKLPLVYGNAILAGNPNESAYKTTPSIGDFIANFKDHAGVNINSPYINVQNSANPATQASVVWADESGLVVNPTISNDFLQFEVPQANIKQGNAVVAVKNASGTIMWSWHLWFAPEEALYTTTFDNAHGVFEFTQENLGWKYTAYNGSTYTKPRIVKIKVMQLPKNNNVRQEATITITQNPGITREGYCTLYQHGNKNAMPGTNTIPEGSFTVGAGNPTYQNIIQRPGVFTPYDRWKQDHWFLNCTNVWSMNNTNYTRQATVVKTVYDPCPAGFHVPSRLAFVDFTTNHTNTSNKAEFNVSGNWNNGWDFNNRIISPDATLWFPVTNVRNHSNAILYGQGYGFCRSAEMFYAVVGNESYFAEIFSYGQTAVNANSGGASHGSYAMSIRPVAE